MITVVDYKVNNLRVFKTAKVVYLVIDNSNHDVALFPSSQRRGGREADGVVSSAKPQARRSDHPVRAIHNTPFVDGTCVCFTRVAVCSARAVALKMVSAIWC